ncbi:short-chain dehydrogenase/reductase SDR (plasmid) [Scytonema sp. HK-05]|uniref:oxidoreductase n=1 Tax=Scytonema sp. HK-05 TaxID=1137095 RepID=UPI00093619F7|nr:oxidoreductase [Scytonema sp. HK-05]OKH53033.1 short-chain dehydrogenase/reductase [Scytonema sp. HK-05]BAY50385.1 short-chain dehydrogenase/reductase SDR [Scytonema sp. HK-05]
MNNTDKVWLITGSSTGLGRALAQAVLERGYHLVATARQPEQLKELNDRYPDRITTIALDVTNAQSIQQAIEAALNAYNRIDVLVNNAGYGTVGAIEEVNDDDIRRQFDTNLFGAINVTRAVLPTLREQRSGHILNISSANGISAFAGVGIYSATKFALEAISEALAQEVKPLGIKVTIIEPGSSRTNFSSRALSTLSHQINDYAQTSGKIVQRLQERDGKQPNDPAKAAAAMIQVVESDNPPLRLALGKDSVNLITQKLESMKAELEAWKDVSMNTAFEEVKASVG